MAPWASEVTNIARRKLALEANTGGPSIPEQLQDRRTNTRRNHFREPQEVTKGSLSHPLRRTWDEHSLGMYIPGMGSVLVHPTLKFVPNSMCWGGGVVGLDGYRRNLLEATRLLFTNPIVPWGWAASNFYQHNLFLKVWDPRNPRGGLAIPYLFACLFGSYRTGWRC